MKVQERERVVTENGIDKEWETQIRNLTIDPLKINRILPLSSVQQASYPFISTVQTSLRRQQVAPSGPSSGLPLFKGHHNRLPQPYIFWQRYWAERSRSTISPSDLATPGVEPKLSAAIKQRSNMRVICPSVSSAVKIKLVLHAPQTAPTAAAPAISSASLKPPSNISSTELSGASPQQRPTSYNNPFLKHPSPLSRLLCPFRPRPTCPLHRPYQWRIMRWPPAGALGLPGSFWTPWLS